MKVFKDASGIVEIDIASGKVNALSAQELSELADTLHQISADSTSRVVLIYTGSGKGFNAGGDLKDIESHPGHLGIVLQCNESLRACDAITKCSVPVIVAIHGFCIGLGIELIGSADITVASEDAYFVFREIDNGTIGGGSQAFRIMPPPVVRYLMFTGGTIQASELYKLGGLSKVVADSPIDHARILARTIAMKDPAIVKDMKSALDGLERYDPAASMRYEQGYIYPLNIKGIGGEFRRKTLKRTSKL